MRMYVELNHDEIEEQLPYAFLCTTRESCIWATGRRRRAWTQQFSKYEREKAEKIFKQCHSWYLVKGVPDSVTMTMSTLTFWSRLAEFCATL